MHTGHLMLVRAESHQHAIDKVQSLVQSDETNPARDWSDWSVIGDEGFAASRWTFNTEFEGEWDGVSTYAVSRDDEKELFRKALNHFYAIRETTFESFLNQIEEYDLHLYKLDQDDKHTYALFKFAQMVESNYNAYSAVYDLENYTANLRYFHEQTDREDETGEREDLGWYGVLVDFHY